MTGLYRRRTPPRAVVDGGVRVPAQVVEACLAHVPRSQVVQAYQRSHLPERRAEVLQVWGDCVAASRPAAASATGSEAVSARGHRQARCTRGSGAEEGTALAGSVPN